MSRRALKLPTSYEVCVSPHERFVAALGRNVVVASLPTRERVGSWHPLSHPSHAAFSSDERLLAVKNTGGDLVVLAVEDGSVLARHSAASRDEGADLLFSPCGDYLVDASWSGEIRVRRIGDLGVAERFHFPGEMITHVSASADKDLWLFLHGPIAVGDKDSPAAPYLTLWQWPLREPLHRMPVGFDTLCRAALAPSNGHIAVAGSPWGADRADLRLITLQGEVVASAELPVGGTGNRVRWSPDSRLVGAVAGGFHIFEAPTLKRAAAIPGAYPSDLAFVSGRAELVLGTWTDGRVIPFP